MADRQAKRRKTEVRTDTNTPIHVLNRQHGDVLVSDRVMLHQGDNNGTLVHNHYYNQPVDGIDSRIEAEQCEKLMDTLSFERMEARLHNVKAALPQTCTWLFRHEHFLAWLDEQQARRNGFL